MSIQSHVVYGHAGNSSAVFPMQRMGFEVWPISTVQFSNHTQYSEGWKGQTFSASHVKDLVDGINNIGKLSSCDAILTGYQGSAEQCLAIVDIVEKVRTYNSDVIYVCDPVMGDPEKGCIVSPDVTKCLVDDVMPIADVIVPNQFELSQFVDMEINNQEDAIIACKKALDKGPSIVLVKHLHCLSEDNFSMMLATKDACYLVQRPHIQFDKNPVGVGDLLSAVFLAGLLKGWSPKQAFRHCNSACYGILLFTQLQDSWELQTISAQEELMTPSHSFRTREISSFSEYTY